MNDMESIEKIHSVYSRLTEQASRVIVGQGQVLEELVIALLAGGHCLLEGVPGLGKTLMVRTLSQTLSLDFQRIQCTPDLMPGDITGSEMFQWGERFFNSAGLSGNSEGGFRETDSSKTQGVGHGGMTFIRGPVFTNILLADEINRTPPRTQSALLEAMQEHQVTIGRNRHPLPEPFFVLATQNPIEQEGTYPLPEAQLDRFMFKSRVEYPSRQEELDILLQTTGSSSRDLEPVLSREELLEAMSLVRRVPVSGPAAGLAVDLCRATRPTDGKGVIDHAKTERGSDPQKRELEEFVNEYLAWGAGPRAGQALLLGARARAILHGRFTVEREDLTALAPSVLRHRIQTRFTADAEGITPDRSIEKICSVLVMR